MKKILVGLTLLFFVLFFSSCAINQKGKITASNNTPPQETHSEQTKGADKVANQNDGKTEYTLARKYQFGFSVTQDSVEAAKWFRKAAEKGHVEAQFDLGDMYSIGDGVPKDYKKAVEWYLKAAEQGHSSSQCSLGEKYYSGNGVPQDFTKAAEWFHKAAEQRHAFAEAFLGEMYFYGQGFSQDYTKAAEWYRRSAEQGHAGAQYILGGMYYNGQGVPKDYTEAVKWFLKVAEREDSIFNNAPAQDALGDMYRFGQGVAQDYTEALKWYRKAAEQGNVGAQSSLGVMYFHGLGVTQNNTEAAKWFHKAASSGDVEAQRVLGFMYQCGLGVTQNYIKAIGWYRKALAQGDDKAQIFLDALLGGIYPGWECLYQGDTEYLFINKDKIRRQKNLVWLWTMDVPFQESDFGKKGTKRCCWIADCDSDKIGLVSYIEYDSNGKIIDSYTSKESEVEMSPVVPGSMGEMLKEYAYSHLKTETRKKEESAKTEPCSGTGWPVTSGFVVTNNHVVAGHNNIVLIRQDGVKIPATIAAHDAYNDLALLEVKDTGLLPAALPLSSKPAALGEKIVTVGYPHPDLLGVKPKLTEGVVNSTSGLGDDPRALQISVPIQAGNSGGPLVNMEGKVVGIVTSKVNAIKMFKWTGDLPQNINYGIKISYLQGLLSSVSPKKRIDTVHPFNNASIEELAEKIKNSVLIIVAE
ncbi:MAG: SEL1-like repeat protein [Deltaproteobacteria bacterium]|nr:SEL1-like repeat protein [Deltaproteobacteria bacterium]